MPGFAFFDLSCLPRFLRRLSITTCAPGPASRALGEGLWVMFDRIFGRMFACGSSTSRGSGEGSTRLHGVPPSPASWQIQRGSRLSKFRVPSLPRRIGWQGAWFVKF